MEGYLPALVTVLRSSPTTAMATLAQMKNFVRTNWYNSFHSLGQPTQRISEADRQLFLQALFPLTLAFSSNYQHSKIIKDIVVLVAFDAVHDYEPAVDCFHQRTHLTSALNFLLGVVAGMRLDFNRTKRHSFHQVTHPLFSYWTTFSPPSSRPSRTAATDWANSSTRCWNGRGSWTDSGRAGTRGGRRAWRGTRRRWRGTGSSRPTSTRWST